MPLREIQEKFTLSEITMQAWRSQEQGFQMRQRSQKVQQQNVRPQQHNSESLLGHDARLEQIRQITEASSTVFEDKQGNFSLKRAKGDEVLAVLSAMGMAGFGPPRRN